MRRDFYFRPREPGDSMGIRFFCPNGHKLHVKSFQAGHKGICPFCGATIDIPLTSTRGSSKGSLGDKSQHSPSPDDEEGINLNAIAPGSASLSHLDNNSFIATDKDQEIELGAPLDRSVSVPSLSTGFGNLNGGGPGMNSYGSAAPGPAAQMPAAPAAPADPFAEAPQAVWFVRPSSGGQYGPASADIMKSWLEEGRVVNDSLIWREGWPDWKEAQNVFPQFAPVSFDMNIFGAKEASKTQTTPVNMTNPISSTSSTSPTPSSQNKSVESGFSKSKEEPAGNFLSAVTVKSGKNGAAAESTMLNQSTINWLDPRNIVIVVQTTIILILLMVAIFK